MKASFSSLFDITRLFPARRRRVSQRRARSRMQSRLFLEGLEDRRLLASDLTVAITDAPDPVAPGSNITYTITLSNIGADAATGVSLSGAIPANTTFVSAAQTAGADIFTETVPPVGGTGSITVTATAPMAGNTSATFQVVAQVNSNVAGGTTITSSATAASTGTGINADANLANNSATTTTAVSGTTDLQITKNDAGATTEVPGTPVTYTITVTNVGNAVVGATVADDVSAILTGATFTAVGSAGASGFSGGSGSINQTVNLAAGATITYTVTGTVIPTLTGTLQNTATITAPTGVTDTTPANNTATDTDQLVPTAELSITKTDNVTTVTAGQTVTYTIVVSNAGPSTVTGAAVSDTFTGLSNVSFTATGTAGTSGFSNSVGAVTALNQSLTLPAGGSVTYTVTGTVSGTAGGSLANTATVTAPTGVTEAGTLPNTATDTDTITATQVTADVTVTKTDSPDPVTAGGNLTYTITVNNIGTGAASTVVLTDVVPANTTFVSFASPAGWVNGTLPAVGGTGTITSTLTGTLAPQTPQVFTLVVRPNASLANQATILNSASVAAAADLNTANNTASATTTVTTSTDISVAKESQTDTVLPGEELTYTITVTNNGLSDAQNVVVTDTLPTDTTFVSATQTSGPAFSLPAPVGGILTATGATLAAGASATFEVTVLVDETVEIGTIISNSVTVATTTTETVLGNNTATADVEVGEEGPLLECIVETFNESGNPGTAFLTEDLDSLEGGTALIITGTSRRDVIIVEPRGSDRIRVLMNGRSRTFDRDDVQAIVVFAGGGNDLVVVNWNLNIDATLFGEAGNDELFGGAGSDGLDGGSGNDRLFGGRNNDTLCGGTGNDKLYGQQGNDLLGGDAGNDLIFGEAGNDLLLGGDGNDLAAGGAGNDFVFGQAGNDKVFGDPGNDVVNGGDGNDKVFGSSGNDILIGGAGSDQLFGEAGDDILIGGSTTIDEDIVALDAILAELSRRTSLQTRINNIRTGGGATGGVALDEFSIIDDGDRDDLWGHGGSDWFIVGPGDRARDVSRNDRRTNVTA